MLYNFKLRLLERYSSNIFSTLTYYFQNANANFDDTVLLLGRLGNRLSTSHGDLPIEMFQSDV